MIGLLPDFFVVVAGSAIFAALVTMLLVYACYTFHAYIVLRKTT